MTTSTNKVAMIMAGGTGGHVFPALAVACALRERGIDVHWLGTRAGLESRVVPEAGFSIEYINIQGLRGNGLLRLIMAPFKLLYSTLQAVRLYMRIKPDFVLGMGGFVTGPGGVACRLLAKPLLIHEQNAIAGMTNTLLSRIATCVLQGFPDTFKAACHAFVTGNPIRSSILQLAQPEQRYNSRTDAIRILIVGGSLGAQALNEVMPQALVAWRDGIQVRHQAGRGKASETASRYAQAGFDVKVEEFIEDMDSAYAWADLIICRSGAMTVSEIAAAGVAAIFVPYPHAVDDHQTANARFLVDADAAILIKQSELTVDRMAEELHKLIGDGRKKLLDMANRAYALAKKNATELVVGHCLEVAK